MRKIFVSTFITLDGIFEAPNIWSLDHFDEEAGKFAGEQFQSCDALLLGRVTYEGFAQAWPNRKGDGAEEMNAIKKYVVTNTLPDPLEWNNSTAIRGNIIEEISKLKEQPGDNILIYGSGQLTRTLLQHGLIDELRLWNIPVIWGKGARLFDGLESIKLELIDSKRLPSGTVILTHGPVKA